MQQSAPNSVPTTLHAYAHRTLASNYKHNTVSN